MNLATIIESAQIFQKLPILAKMYPETFSLINFRIPLKNESMMILKVELKIPFQKEVAMQLLTICNFNGIIS